MDSPSTTLSPAEEPRVIFWHRVYCAVMTALYAVVTLIGVGAIVFRGPLAEGDPDAEIEMIVSGVVFLGMGIVLAGVFAASFFLPRKRWAWVYHIVLICIGLTSCCTLPASIALLLNWIKPDVQALFGR